MSGIDLYAAVDFPRGETMAEGVMERRLRDALSYIRHASGASSLTGKSCKWCREPNVLGQENHDDFCPVTTAFLAVRFPKTQAEKLAVAGEAARALLHYWVGNPHKCISCHADLEKDPDHSDCPEPVCPGKTWHEAEKKVSRV